MRDSLVRFYQATLSPRENRGKALLYTSILIVGVIAVGVAFALFDFNWMWYGVFVGVILGLLVGTAILSSGMPGLEGGSIGFALGSLFDLGVAQIGDGNASTISTIAKWVASACDTVVDSVFGMAGIAANEAIVAIALWTALIAGGLVILIAKILG